MKYDQLSERKGILASIRLIWFIFFTALRDMNKKHTDQFKESELWRILSATLLNIQTTDKVAISPINLNKDDCEWAIGELSILVKFAKSPAKAPKPQKRTVPGKIPNKPNV